MAVAALLAYAAMLSSIVAGAIALRVLDSWELLREDESAAQPLDGMTRTTAYLFALVLPLLARVALAAKVGAAALLGVAYQR